MGYQSNFNRYVAFKAQAALGTPASGTGALILRDAGGSEGKLTKNAIKSKENRRDAQQTRGRHGMQKTAGGPYDTEMSIGLMDGILQAVMRGTWDAEITKTAADFTSITIASNVITLNSGDPRALGFRVYDIMRITGSDTAANNDRNLRIAGMTASTITVAPPPDADDLTDAGIADTNASLVRVGRKVIMPAAGSLVNTYFSVEEYEADMDQSEFFANCLWSGIKFTMQPDGLLMASPSWVGTGDFTVEPSESSPVFTDPSTPTGVQLAVKDATLRLGDTDIVELTAFDLTLDNGAVAPPVAAGKTSPTVMGGQNQVSMNLTLLRKDMTYVSAFLNETGLSLNLLAVEESAEPKAFFALNVPFFTLGGVDKSTASNAGGARTQTLAVPTDLVGTDTSGTGYDRTMLSFQISNTE